MIKLSELAKYCKSIDIDCWSCEKKDACNRMMSYMEEQSPVGIIAAVKEDKEF